MQSRPHIDVTVEWNATDRRHWTRHLKSVPYAAYQQDFAYGEMLNRVGATVHRAILHDPQGPLALCQIQRRNVFGLFTIAMAMMGPVWLRRDLTTEQKAAALSALANTYPKEPRTAFLTMPPDDDTQPYKALKAPRVVSSYHTALIDLSPPLEDIRSAMNGKWRNRLVAAEKSDLSIHRLPQEASHYEWLLIREKEQRKKIRYQGLPVQMVPAFQDVAGPDSVRAYAARLDGKDVAGCLFLRHGTTATYHIGWSGPDGKALNAHNLLLWTAIEDLHAKGVKTLDLGGMTGDKGDGLIRFKLGTGATPLSQAGTYLLKPKWR